MHSLKFCWSLNTVTSNDTKCIKLAAIGMIEKGFYYVHTDVTGKKDKLYRT